jgi:hypothetical protein
MGNTTANIFASSALILWPLVSIFLYRLKPIPEATLWTILAGELLLPVGTFFKIEMIPQLDKGSIPTLCALFGCMIVSGRHLQSRKKFGFIEIVVLMYLFSPVITSLLNQDFIVVGGIVLPGVGIYDGLSALLNQFIALIPFFLGRQFLREFKHTHQILNVLVVAGVAYSIPLLFEIRFSPQLHFWIYGYYPSAFIQEMREDGGFRPMVFMGHGLLASFFAMTTVVASAALWRTNDRLFGVKAAGWFTFYLGFVLYLCKSGAATIYGLVLTPLVRLGTPKMQMRVAASLVSLALLYPLLRMTEFFPTQLLVDGAAAVNKPRAVSLQFRFEQEETLLQHASDRSWFGWGRFGRNRVYNKDWQGVGVDNSVTDGRWIITLGQFGIVGFLAEFGLLAMPVFRGMRVLKSVQSFQASLYLAAICLILAVNLIDLLPNSALSPWTWLLAGSLLGVSETARADDRSKARKTNFSSQYSLASQSVRRTDS